MGRAKRIAIYVLSTAVALTAFTGVMHLPFARHFLMRLGGCPIGTPEQTEASRKTALQNARGTEIAPSRPALGFALDGTTLDDVRAWASARGLACEESREATLVRCTNVPATSIDDASGGTIAEVAFGLSPSTGRVVAVTTMRNALSGAEAATDMTAVSQRLAATLGKPAATAGAVDSAFLSAGDYHTATIEYAFRDYLATVTATRIPGRGVVLREEYLSARD